MDKMDLLKYGLNRDSYVWEVGTPSWVVASSIDDLADILPPVPPFQNQNQQTYQPMSQNAPYMRDPEVNSKKITAGLLAILLGGLGIHYFYLGKTTAGIISIVLTLFTCSIWSFIMLVQGILMLTMDDATFARKYIESDATLPLF